MELCSLKNIIYVEDDTDIQTIMSIALEDIGGLNVKVCSNEEEFMKILPGSYPDLFLLDIMLPGTSGMEILSKIRKIPQYEKTPAIFISAKPFSAGTTNEKGVIGIISKPFDPMKIAEHIKVLWNNYQSK